METQAFRNLEPERVRIWTVGDPQTLTVRWHFRPIGTVTRFWEVYRLASAALPELKVLGHTVSGPSEQAVVFARHLRDVGGVQFVEEDNVR